MAATKIVILVNPRVPQNMVNFLTSLENISFSRRTFFLEVWIDLAQDRDN